MLCRRSSLYPPSPFTRVPALVWDTARSHVSDDGLWEWAGHGDGVDALLESTWLWIDGMSSISKALETVKMLETYWSAAICRPSCRLVCRPRPFPRSWSSCSRRHCRGYAASWETLRSCCIRQPRTVPKSEEDFRNCNKQSVMSKRFGSWTSVTVTLSPWQGSRRDMPSTAGAPWELLLTFWYGRVEQLRQELRRDSDLSFGKRQSCLRLTISQSGI